MRKNNKQRSKMIGMLYVIILPIKNVNPLLFNDIYLYLIAQYVFSPSQESRISSS